MKALLDAIVAKCKATSAIAAFSGTGGPFWDIAPEATSEPFMVITQIGGTENKLGFASGAYVEPVQIQFAVYAVGAAVAAGHAETLCNTFDALTSLTVTGGTSRRPLRRQPVRLAADEVDGNGKRIYQASVVYDFCVQRTLGV